MKTNYSISIPKPCHKDWSKMTPNEKGRFCQSCSKTVVDFTEMGVDEIQNYIHTNKNQRICGHIKQSQLNAINVKIPESVFNETWNFHKLFLLALLLAMGTTLLNCSDNTGKKQKINNVEIIETNQKVVDTASKIMKMKEVKTDSSSLKKTKPVEPKVKEIEIIDGMMIIETIGDIEVIPIDDVESVDKDSLEIEIPEIVGELIIPPDDEIVFGLMIIENPPEFTDTPSNLTKADKKEYFSNRVTEIVNENFNINIAELYGIKGKQRIFTQFKIDEQGIVRDIKVRSSSHLALEKEAIRVIKLLPKFKPAKQRGENIGMVYTLPIVFVVKD